MFAVMKAHSVCVCVWDNRVSFSPSEEQLQ